MMLPSVVAVITLLGVSASQAQQSYVSPTATPVISPPLRSVTPVVVPESETKHLVENRYKTPPAGAKPAPRVIDTAIQKTPSANAAIPGVVSSANFDGIPVGNSAPPDTDGAVGKNHYVQMVNSRFAIWDKTGTLKYGPVNINTLWQFLGGTCAKHNDGDPVVIYDRLADRYFLSQFAVFAAGPTTDGKHSHECVAISMSGDPLGSYYLYDFVLDDDDFVDYPHIGTWTDSYYETGHYFKEIGTDSGQALFAFERNAMLAGKPARVALNRGLSNITGGAAAYGALPADIDSLTPPPAGAKALIVAHGSPDVINDDGSTAFVLHTWTASTDWSKAIPVLTIGPMQDLTAAPYNPEVCPYSIAFAISPLGDRPCIPEPPPAQPPPAAAPPTTGLPYTDWLDVISDRLMFRVGYRNFLKPDGSADHESFVLNFTVAKAPNQAAIRWYELRRATPAAAPTVAQESTFAGPSAADAESRWMGSIAMDNSGNIALGYSRSSLTTMPEMDVTGRLAADAASTMTGETILKVGQGIQQGTGNRWGDYSAMAVDAFDGCTFWFTSEYLPATGQFNWRTRIAAFKFSACTAPAQGVIQGTIADKFGAVPIAGAIVTAGSFSGGTDSAGRYSITVPPGAYVLTAASEPHFCITTEPPSPSVVVTNGGLVTQNFLMTGLPDLQFRSVSVDDGTGNGNGSINRDECATVVINLVNNGCALASGITSKLTTTTPGVTVSQDTSAYPDIPVNGAATEATAFRVTTAASFVCGTPINLSLAVTVGTTTKSFGMTLPTCAAAAIANTGSITAGDTQQQVRLSRDGNASACGTNKTCPAAIAGGTGTRSFDQYTYTNTAAVPACVNVHLTAASDCAGTNQIQSAAYLNSFDPANLCTNYIADSGSSPDTGYNDYSFDVAAGAKFVVTVNGVQAGGVCSRYDLSVSGLIDQTPAVCRLATAIAVSSSLNPSIAGDPVTFTATVTPPAATGTVTFKDGTATLGTGTLSSGIATFTTSTLTVGSHPVTAVYGGDSSFGPSTSPLVAQTVNSAPVGAFSFTAASYTISEGAGTATLTVQRSGGSNGTATVDYAVSGGTATNGGVDYTLTPGTLTFANGETVKNIVVTIVDDTIPEPPETVGVTLSNTTAGASLTPPSSTTLTILDNDNVLPTITSLSPNTVCQGSPAITLAVFGTNFVNGAVVQFRGAERPTTFVNAQKLTVAVPASDLSQAGPIPVRVVNPDASASSNATLDVAADTAPPIVSAPQSITLMQTTCAADGTPGASGNSSSVVSGFLSGASASDNCGIPTALPNQVAGNDINQATLFRAGTTTVAFRFSDRAGNVGTATSTVNVRLLGDLSNDNAVDAQDLVILANYLVGNVAAGTSPFNATVDSADLNVDGRIDALDLVIHTNHLAGNIRCLPAR